MSEKNSFFMGLVETFLKGNLSVLMIIICLVAGALALAVTPREEEPQIVVPLADILVSYPGGTAEEVEQMVSSRLERMLHQIDGVEYVYSMSRPGMAVVTVRFFVGEDREGSLIKLYNKLQQNMDRVTPGISGWVVKPIEIDDVPIVNIALHSERYDTHDLYRLAEEVVAKLQHIPDSAKISIHGGERRVVYVYLDTERLSAHELTAGQVMQAVRLSNSQLHVGQFEQNDEVAHVMAGPFLMDVAETANLLIGLHDGRPVYLRDVASVVDGPEEAVSYSRLRFGPAGDPDAPRGGSVAFASENLSNFEPGKARSAVTIGVAKKKGSNAVWVAREIERLLKDLKGSVIPDGVAYRITRDYGETADDKVGDLIGSLALAIISVIGLITFVMSWREGVVIAVAVPITYSIVLLCNYLAGYTINRVTLFALILALGLLVDDPIVSVDNITRHLAMGKDSKLKAISDAMREIIGALILTTLAIIVSFVPMFFITGMMGPYMQPMALNVPLAVIASTLVALTITPWVSSKIIRQTRRNGESKSFDIADTPVYRFYSRLMRPLVESRSKGVMLLAMVAVLFGISLLLAVFKVPLKMLPYDNKNEFQVLVDMPEGTTLERTDAVARDVEALLLTVPEVTDLTTKVGVSTPMDFNGLVRHYYLREGRHTADIRVNLLHRDQRKQSSHSLTLALRNEIDEIAENHGANIKLIEAPPGPPVLATLVAEIYGANHHSYQDLVEASETVKTAMLNEQGVVDVDSSVERRQRQWFFRTDRAKAGLNGISVDDITNALRIALDGAECGVLHLPTEQHELPLIFRLPREQRSDVALLRTIMITGRDGQRVQLGEIGEFEEQLTDVTIHHKNHEKVVYVMGEMAGRGPAYAVLNLQRLFRKNPLPPGIRIDWRGEGEWKITVDVFRDLGIAFGIALLAIYVLLVYETGSYLLPVIVMLAIPLTLIGIMPGFWLLNALAAGTVDGYPDPIFFTATAMIGMIALGGIVVRNGIMLLEFIKTRLAEGKPLFDAVYEAGAVRLRPIFLTAGTTVLGVWPITLDPIFSGLAWALIFGLFVSTTFTLVVIPLTYCMVYGRKDIRQLGKKEKS